MKHRLILTLGALAALSACGGAQGDYPALLPTAEALAEPAIPAHAGGASPTGEDITARADALRARADALRRPVIEPATRARMKARPGG